MIRIAGYPMDLALAEDHTFPGDMTSNPVEVGPDVTDHIRDLPPEITLECIVSDTPSGDVARDPSRTNATLPSVEALEKLIELKALRRVVTVETSIGVFENMGFLDLNVSADAERSLGRQDPGGSAAKLVPGALFFSVTFRRARLVENRRTRVRVKTRMAGAGGKAKSRVVAVDAIQIDNLIEWRHGVPAGTPFKAGNPIETVAANYGKPPGLTRDEAIALGKVSPGSTFITYVDAKNVKIVGARRQALVADLLRDADAKRQAPFGPQLSPDEQLKRDQNLPTGLTLERFKRPAPGPTISQPFDGVP